MKLTDNIAAAYFNAGVLHAGNTYEMHGVMRGIIEVFTLEDSDQFELLECSECQLELTPLSAITDEHAIEVAKMSSNYNEFAFSQHQDYVDMVIADGIGIALNWMKNQGLSAFICDQQAQYLRSRNYDCGYGSIPSLIDAGIAVVKQ